MRDLPNLDFLRAVAVLSVVVAHALYAEGVRSVGNWQVQWIGVVGVFLFFVHTTLVLMWSLERKPHTLDFYIRRIFRIYPLAIVATLAAWLLHAPIAGLFAYAAPTSWKDVVTALSLAGSLGNGYAVVGVTWSLVYELQMYVVLPVLFFFVRRNFQQWPLILLWAFTALINFRMFSPEIPHNFYLCIPYFLPGVMAYVGFGRRKALLPAWTFPIAVALAWILFMRYPGWRIADVLCLAVGLLLPSFHQIRSAWLIRISHFIAKYSYGIYLAHSFGLVLGVYLLPHESHTLQISVFLAATSVLAVVGYHLIEHPMIRLGSRLANRAEKRFEQYEADKLRIPANEID